MTSTDNLNNTQPQKTAKEQFEILVLYFREFHVNHRIEAEQWPLSQRYKAWKDIFKAFNASVLKDKYENVETAIIGHCKWTYYEYGRSMSEYHKADLLLEYEKELKEIPKRNRDVVFGFIKGTEDVMSKNHHIIPAEIKIICLQYFNLNKDTFNCNANDIDQLCTINSDQVSLMEDQSNKVYINVFLDNIVSKGQNIWRFQCDSSLESLVGIHSTKYEQLLYMEKEEIASTGYGLTTFGNITNEKDPKEWGYRAYASYDEEWVEENDVISMILDMDSLTLSYKINDFDYGKAFDVAPGQYTAAVAIPIAAKGGNGWKLISFQHVC